LFSAKKSLAGVQEHCREEKPTLRSQFVEAFSSDLILKATKHINVHFFIQSSNSCKLYPRNPVGHTGEFREISEAIMYIRMFLDS
jgi:hypothetical protein